MKKHKKLIITLIVVIVIIIFVIVFFTIKNKSSKSSEEIPRDMGQFIGEDKKERTENGANGIYLVAPYDCYITELNLPDLNGKILNSHYIGIASSNSLMVTMNVDETNIEKICKWFKLSYSVSSNAVFVRTAFSRWIVYLQEDKVKELFHENYRANKSQYFNKQKMKCTEGYHKQKLPSESFFEVIQYINYHDAGTVKRMVKKSRLEKLLEMVEMELKMKNMEEKDYGYDNMPELRRTNIG